MARWSALLTVAMALMGWMAAAKGETRPLIAFGDAGVRSRIGVHSADAEFAVVDVQGGKALLMTVHPGADAWPGINIRPEMAGGWDLSKYGYVEAALVNTGTERISVCLSVEGAQPGKGSAEQVALDPGARGVVRTYLGYGFGQPVAEFDASKVSQLLLFMKKPAGLRTIRIESISAGGEAGERPPVAKANVSVKPKGGVIWSGVEAVDGARQFAVKGNARATVSPGGKALRMEFAAGKEGAATFKPAEGTWNLNEQLQVRVKLRNAGRSAAKANVQLESRKGPSEPVSSELMEPGAEAEVLIPFAAKTIWMGAVEPAQNVLEGKKNWEGVPGTGTAYASNVTTGVTVKAQGAVLEIISVLAELPKYEGAPPWLGKRPPVEGDWVKTFEDNFDGDHIDLTKWNVHSENYGDQRMHFTKDNAIVGDGKLALRFEKKRGRHNDEPDGKESDYATGWADTYGKWVQRYGYFEARMKLPSGPNRFTAFWLMPDRGLKAGGQAQRASTKDGGMEFDIMETLSIWGVHRHDFGMHWDGYVKYHKSIGGFAFYQRADEEGFITVGMLWTPGLVAMYDNGKETARWQTPRISNVPSHIIFDHVMGGWEAEPMDESRLPEDFVIDWVRAWQRKDLASEVDGPKPNKGTPGAPTE